MNYLVRVCVVLFSAGMFNTGANAQDRGADFNKFVLQAVDMLAKQRGKLGYDLGGNFTKDLQYGDQCCVRASKKAPKTQCVAATAEVIITAIGLYKKDNPKFDLEAKLPMITWNRSTPADIRPYIWMFKGMDSNGTGSALERFRIGSQITFLELRPGDFVNFNRTNGTGHAAVFLSYIDRKGDDVSAYDENRVAGFRYFSAQGANKPDGGLDYRWAYFSNFCPLPNASRPRDCGVIRNFSERYLNAGFMYSPERWPDYKVTVARIRNTLLTTAIKNSGGFVLKSDELIASVEKQLNAVVQESPAVNFNGLTTD